MRLAWKNILHDWSRLATSEHVREIAMGIRCGKGSLNGTTFAEVESQPVGMKRSPCPPPLLRSAGAAKGVEGASLVSQRIVQNREPGNPLK